MVAAIDETLIEDEVQQLSITFGQLFQNLVINLFFAICSS